MERPKPVEFKFSVEANIVSDPSRRRTLRRSRSTVQRERR